MLEKKKKNLQLKFLVCLSFVGVCVLCCVCGLVSKNFLFFFGEDKKKKKRNFFLVIFYTPLLVMVTILLNIEVFWNIIDL